MQTIKLETAKLAKEKRFGFQSPAYYACDEADNKFNLSFWTRIDELGEIESQDGTLVYQAPYQIQLQDWLRNKHNIQIDMFYEDGWHSGRVQRIGDPERIWRSASTLVYEETLESMLYHGLTLITYGKTKT